MLSCPDAATTQYRASSLYRTLLLAHSLELKNINISHLNLLLCIGSRSFRALYVSRSTLKSILLLTGSQCREASTGEMCSYFLVLVSVRAAAFCISWRLFIELRSELKELWRVKGLSI